MRYASALFALVLFSLSLLSTGCGNSQCLDCGPCGLAGGPTGQTGMRIGDAGRADNGMPAVDVFFYSIENPACDIEDEGGVVYDPESQTATFVADSRPVTYDEQEYSPVGVYNWSDEGVELTARKESETRVSLLFAQDGQELRVECTVDESEQIMCE